MSAYYPRLACWFLSDHYKAAYNVLFVDLTAKLLEPRVVHAANLRVRACIGEIGFEVDPGPQILNCLLAQAFAEMDIYPRLMRDDGTLFVACWYRIPNIINACASITPADIDNAIGWLTRMREGKRRER